MSVLHGRGRQSLKVIEGMGVARPSPPSRMGEDEALIWRQTVEALPADWFRPETLAILEQYCSHVMRARSIAKKIRTEQRVDQALYALELKETKMVATLATKMRLTQQSTLDRKKSKHAKSAVVKPWDMDAKPVADDDEAED